MLEDKTNTILGETDFNVASYGEGEYKVHKLPLKNTLTADTEEPYLEVSIKGVPSAPKNKGGDSSSSRGSNMLRSQATTISSKSSEDKRESVIIQQSDQQIAILREAVRAEQEKREKMRQKYEPKAETLNAEIKDLES